MATRPQRYAGFLRFDSYSSIILNQQDTLQFYVELRSPRPKKTQSFVTCFASDLEPWGFRDVGEHEDERIERLWFWLSSRLLTFAIEQKPGKSRNQVHWNAIDLRVHPFNVEKGDLWLYVPVPRLERYAASVPLFEAIQRGNPVRDFLPPETGGREIVALVHDQYIGPFKPMGSAGGLGGGLKPARKGIGMLPMQIDGLQVIDDLDWVFVEEQRYEALLQELARAAEHEPILALPEAPEPAQPDAIAPFGGGPVPIPASIGEGAGPATVAAPMGGGAGPATVAAPMGGGAGSETIPAPMGGGAWPETSPTQIGGSAGPVGTSDAPAAPPTRSRSQRAGGAPAWSEEGFLQELEAEAVAQELFYRPGELLGFHAALKSGTLVILAGLSGTGKSRLVEVYRRALGLKEGEEFLWIPVRPSWSDDADLIGYYDPLHQQYRPGETGLVDLLVRAEQNPDRLFMVCFDEMNLARVEHYFSQFLSVLERPLSQRVLRLYAGELAPAVANGDRYPPEVSLGPNVLFCGTINMDESTHTLSDKVLDRSSVIRVSHVDIQQWWEQTCRQGVGGDGAPTLPEPISFPQWSAWQRPFDPRPFGREITLLQALNQALAQAGADQTFGYRVARQILLALQNLPRRVTGEPLLSPPTVLDSQIAQRILPKIRGSRAELEPLLGPQGSLRRLLSGSDLSPFTFSLAEIERKWQELERHEFTA